MSVSTPILTTSSEIWAFAAPLYAAKARPAANAAASDFMVSSPGLLLRLDRGASVLSGFAGARKADFLAMPVPLQSRQRRHRNIDGALGFRDHAQRSGIEGDVGKPQAGDFRRHPHAILVVLKIRDRGCEFLLRVRCERFEIDGGLVGKCFLQMRHRRACRG